MRATNPAHSSRTRAPSEGSGIGPPSLMGWIVMRTACGLIENTEISTGADAIVIGISESAALAGLINATAPAEMTALRASLRLNRLLIDEHSPLRCSRSLSFLSFLSESIIVEYLLSVEICHESVSSTFAGSSQAGVPMVNPICCQGTSTAHWVTVSGPKKDGMFIQQNVDCIQLCIHVFFSHGCLPQDLAPLSTSLESHGEAHATPRRIVRLDS